MRVCNMNNKRASDRTVSFGLVSQCKSHPTESGNEICFVTRLIHHLSWHNVMITGSSGVLFYWRRYAAFLFNYHPVIFDIYEGVVDTSRYPGINLWGQW